MKLQQITVSLENSHGRLYEVTNALGKAGINLRAASLVDTGAFGQLRLLVSDIPEARRILMEMMLPAHVDEVIAIEIEDSPGSLAKLLECFLETKVNIIYTYAMAGFTSERAVMIFRFNDNEEAIKILKDRNVKILDAKTLGILK